MDWSGEAEPTVEAIAGSNVIAQGNMNVITLKDTQSKVLGYRDLFLDDISGLLQISHRSGGTVWLYEGATRLRPATIDERQNLPLLGTWGRRFIQKLAEKYLVPQ
jgi:hypothetical protein